MKGDVSKHAFVSNAARAIALLLMLPWTAGAQGFGVRTGANVNPDQLTVGGQYDLGAVTDSLWVQPSADLGFGDGATLVTANLDLIYRRPLGRRSPWTMYAGGGPAVNFYKLTGYNRTLAGVNVLGGLTHRSGLFAQCSVGMIDSPRLQLGVGYTFRLAQERRKGPPRR